MTVDLYSMPVSPPTRAVMLLANAVGVHLNCKFTNVFRGEQMTPEYAKISAQRTIPTLDDNGFLLSESRAIMGYLVSKYAKDDSLYPADPRKKGTIDQRLYFDLGVLYNRIMKCWFFFTFGMAEEIEEKNVRAVEKAFEILDVFLEGNDYVAGPDLSIADFSFIVSVTLAQVFGFDVARYDNVAAWFERCGTEMKKYGYDEFVADASRMGDLAREAMAPPE